MDKKTEPFVTDERIAYMRLGCGLASVGNDTDPISALQDAAEGGCRFAMNLYEPELQALRERMEKMEAALKKAQSAICYAMEEGIETGGTEYIDAALSNK